MKELEKIIESLEVTFIKAGHIRMLQPLMLEHFYDVENILLLVNRGHIAYTQEGSQQYAAAGDILFIPGGKATTLTYGAVDRAQWSQAYFSDNRSKFLQALQAPAFDAPFDNCSYITFDAKIFKAVNLFASLGIFPFTISDNPGLSDTLKQILIEDSTPHVGSSRMIKVNTERLTIEIIRHLLANSPSKDKLVTNSQHFRDPRLVTLLNYIQDNLQGNLSNSVLATIAHVSEDYVGQYFKMLTGVNIQDYIAYQRMERAVKLLRTTQESIQDIGKEVGFKDTAYFCRRFKMMFGISAGKMRKQELVIRS